MTLSLLEFWWAVIAGAIGFGLLSAAVIMLVVQHQKRMCDVRLASLAELEKSEKRYRLMIEAAPVPIMVCDSDVILYANRNALDLMGLSEASQAAGRPVAQFIHPGLSEMVQGQLGAGGEAPVPARLYARDGRIAELELKVMQVFYEGRQAYQIVGLDVSERKRLQAERQRLEEAKHQQHKMEALGHLAGGVAHDFNNALSGIMGSAEILLLKLFDRPELASLAEKILKASEHAAGLTRQLLGFSRKGHLLMVRVSLHEIINNTMDIVRNTIDKRISIELSLKARSDSITGDASQLHHCLLNLAINARDAMPNGGRLLISTDTMELDDDCINRKQLAVRCGRYVKVSVSDTGIGMSEEVKKHLYEPFFTTKNDGRSTGLGLAGVYGCIKNHDGALELVSDPGQGTTFSIYIPLTEDRPAEPVDIQKPDISHGSGRIFLVDDESIVRDVAGQMLRHLGYQVQFSSNGTEAVDFYKKHQKEIDLVILDMIMPGCNGREAYFRMKEANPNVKVLLSSGYCSRQEVKEAVEAGLQGFLQKPFSLSELSQKIKEILK